MNGRRERLERSQNWAFAVRHQVPVGSIRVATRQKPWFVAPGRTGISRYDIQYVEIYRSARRHGVADDDIAQAIEHALAVGEQDDAKVLHLAQTAPETFSKSSR